MSRASELSWNASDRSAEVPAGSSGDTAVVGRLLSRDEGAFRDLVGRYHERLLRLALTFVSNRAAAEEVVQETWLGVLQGLRAFEGRSSLKTWIFRILSRAGHRPMLTCRQITGLVTDYLEGRLPLGQRLRFQVHLGMCRNCRWYLSQMKSTIRTLNWLRPASIPEVPEEILRRFRDWGGRAP